MSARYIPYEMQTRPTRNSVIEALIETQIELSKILKRLDVIVKRECAHIRKKNKIEPK
ncbi:MAG: hypothetical protein IKW67_03015 [Alphaproteobacteria bacterium]|nr:hypothetical protein [Alphaproteobacteria bacterium]